MEGMMSITVKPLEWVPVYYDGRDRVAKTPLGDYVISVDSDLAGGLHYLWVAGQSQDDEHHSVYKTMTAAKSAAFADYSARIMSAIEPAGVGVETVRHKKRGTTYEVIGVGKMQTESWTEEVLGADEDGRNAWVNQSVDMQPVTIYRSADDGQIWVRPVEEFNDGRFEHLPASSMTRDTTEASEALEEAAKVAEQFGANRPLAERRPPERIMGRWEGEQAASAAIAAAIRALKEKP